jgi:hypothetical protein
MTPPTKQCANETPGLYARSNGKVQQVAAYTSSACSRAARACNIEPVIGHRHRALAAALAVAALACRRKPEPPLTPGEISTRVLVDEMGRLDQLARLPAAPFSSRQSTSYDRRSRTAADPATWFANDDYVTDTALNLVRVDDTPAGKRWVILDVDGPGAVVRMWTAMPTGTLRVYIDGEPRPALEAPMGKLLGGDVPPFSPPFAQVTAMGYSLYFPFPYQRHCTITVDSIQTIDPFSGKTIPRLFYQVGYRTYAPDAAANVRSYDAGELALARGAMARAAAAMNGAPAAAPAGRRTVTLVPTAVAPGVPLSATWDAPPGGGRVAALRLASSERDPEKLRATWLSMSFDGEETVRAPLVDFFGTGPGWNAYASLPMTVDADGTLLCRFPMPFATRGTLTVTREAPGTVDVRGSLAIDPAPFDESTLLFHAKQRPDESFATRPIRDWHIATLAGRGRLVGTVLGAENPPNAAWWGEGDEKIYVDGETFPSWFGTGTEDYFGYAWSSLVRFAHPYHAQTLTPTGSFAGRFSMNRFHVLDPIPFERGLTFDIEAWHWTDTRMSLEATLYWYARPGGTDDFRSDPRDP